MKALMSKIKDSASGGDLETKEHPHLVMAGCYFAIMCVDSLRGPEGLLLNLGGLRNDFVKGCQNEG
jgi:hypothetical protein